MWHVTFLHQGHQWINFSSCLQTVFSSDLNRKTLTVHTRECECLHTYSSLALICLYLNELKKYTDGNSSLTVKVTGREIGVSLDAEQL